MRRFGKLITGVMIAAAFFISSATSAFADGSITLSGDKDTGVVGDTYTVTVTAENPEGAAVAPDIQITYDPNRLSFVDCSAAYGGGGGGLISLTETSATISFTVLSGGGASVDATAVFDGDGANTQSSSVSIFVEGEDTAGSSEAMPIDDMGLDAGTVASADGTKYVSTVFASEFMPVGFYKTNVSYEEQMVEAAQFDMGNIVLLYVTDADGNNGNFDIYNPETGELSDFLQLSGIENRFIIALKADESVAVPEGVTKATLQWNEQVLEAYAFNSEINQDGVSSNDFFLIYAVSSEGNKGFYLYDQKEGTYQRYLGAGSGNGGSDTPGTGGLFAGVSNSVSSDSNAGIPLWMLIAGIVLAVLCLGLLIAVIIMGVKLREFNSYEYIDEDEDDEDEEDDDTIIAPSVSRKSAAKAEQNDSYLERLAKAQEEDSNPLAKGAYRSGKAGVDDKAVRRDEKEVIETSNEKKKITASDLASKAMNDEEAIEEVKEEIKEEIREEIKADSSEKSAEKSEEISDEMPDEMPKTENIYEKYRMADEMAAASPVNNEDSEEILDRKERMRRAALELDDEPRGLFGRNKNKYDDFEDEEIEDDEDDLEDDYRGRSRMSRADKKALKAEEKARKKAEKKMRKEYGEFGPANFSQWQEAVRDDRKIDNLEEAPTVDSFMGNGVTQTPSKPVKQQKSSRDTRYDELENEGFNVRRRSKKTEFEDDYEDTFKTKKRSEKRSDRYERELEEPDAYGFSEVPVKENPQDMMRKLPANDYNHPVQPKPVQQFDFDDDFEFEFLSLDDED